MARVHDSSTNLTL